MLEFSDGPARVTTPPPPAYTAPEADALGMALREAAAALAGPDPSCGVTPFLLCDVLDPEPPREGVDAFLEAVCVYVRARRDDGASPEQVVIGVKRHLQVALGATADPRRVNAWLAHAVTWGIEAYYRAD